MRPYSLSNGPQNFGQAVGGILSGTVAPYLENEQKRRYLGQQLALQRGLKERDFQAEQAYRQGMLGHNAGMLDETNRHNLAMEGKTKAATAYHPNTIQEAVAYLTLHPEEDPTGKIRQELEGLYGTFKPGKAPVDPNSPSSYPQIREDAKDEQTAALNRFDPRIRSGLAKISGSAPGQFNPYTYSQQGLSGMRRSDLVAAGRQYLGLLDPEAAAATDSMTTAMGTKPLGLRKLWDTGPMPTDTGGTSGASGLGASIQTKARAMFPDFDTLDEPDQNEILSDIAAGRI